MKKKPKKPIPFPKSTRMSSQMPRNHGKPKEKLPSPRKAKQEAAASAAATESPTIVPSALRFACWKCGAAPGEWCCFNYLGQQGQLLIPLCKERAFKPTKKPKKKPAPTLTEWYETQTPSMVDWFEEQSK